MRKAAWGFGIAVYCYALLTAAAGNPLELSNARIVSMTGEAPFIGTIRIQGGVIQEVSPDGQESINSIDLTGYTILPGLIDSHVHLQTVPGSAFRKDTEATKKQLREHHMRAYLASGVTTVLDTGISAPILTQLENYLHTGGPGPRLLSLAPVLYTSGGYLDSDLVKTSSKPAKTEQDVKDLFDEYQNNKSVVGVKVPIEYAFSPIHIWPIHSPEMRSTITRISNQKSRPIYVHATSEEEQQIALDMGAHALVHSGYWDEAPSAEFLSQLVSKGTYLVSTLSGTLDLKLVEYDQSRLDDPLYKLVVPEVELETARNKEAWRWSTLQTGRSLKPDWVPNFLSDFISPIMMDEDAIHEWLSSAASAVKILHDAGVPIVVGTDAGNYPIILNFFHGPSTIRELELLAAAGLSNLEVLLAATVTPSKMLSLDEKIGTIEAGKTADLIIVKGDPLEDISVLRQVSWVIRNGEMKTPKEWLQASSQERDTIH